MEDLISRLMSKERRKWQDPERIVEFSGIKEGMRVADIGAGPGFFTIPIAKKVGRNGIVYAVEKEKEMIIHLESNIKRENLQDIVRIIHAPAERTGLSDSSVDVAFIANVFHDIQDKKSVLSEINRILVKEGKVVNIDWKMKPSPVGPPIEIRIPMRLELQIFERNGFRLLEKIQAGRYHYGFILKKKF
jgi:FkbM family methyltransferase